MTLLILFCIIKSYIIPAIYLQLVDKIAFTFGIRDNGLYLDKLLRKHISETHPT